MSVLDYMKENLKHNLKMNFIADKYLKELSNHRQEFRDLMTERKQRTANMNCEKGGVFIVPIFVSFPVEKGKCLLT